MSNNPIMKSPGISFSRARYHLLNAEARTRKRAIQEIKEGLVYPDLCHSIDFLCKNIHPSRQELFWGIPLPKKYSELGDIKEFPYTGKIEKGVWKSGDINAEINLCLIGIRKYYYEINLFLQYKEEFENNLLVGNYDQATILLEKIENDICCSLWTLENRFVLMELSGNASESKEFLSYFNDINQSDGITKSLAHYLCLRAEHSLSINRYFSDLDYSLNEIRDSNTREAFQNYYRFKLTFLNHIDFNHYAEIISIDFCHSIIDRYLNLVKVLTNLLAVSSYLNDGVERKILLKGYLRNRINYLIKKVKDPTLFKLKLLSGDAVFPAFDTRKSELEVKIIDNYTTGLYDIAERELVALLSERPAQFDLYVLYIKTLVYQKKPFIPIGAKKSVQNEVLADMYKIVSVTINPSQAAMNLLRIANNLASCHLSYGITDFVFFQTQGRKERMLLSRISYGAANPIIHEVFTNDDLKRDYLELLEKRFPDSITVDFFKEKVKGVEFLPKFESKIPNGKFRLEVARRYQSSDNFLGASIEWKFLIENYKDTPPILETAIVNLFKCQLELDQLDDAIHLFVDSYFFNNYIIDKIETTTILKKIASNKFRNVSRTIELPIFYTIVDADPIETHIAFELFNTAYGIERPAHWITKIDEFDYKKMIFFLEFTCGPRVLMHSTFIERSKDRLEERLTIANFVKEKDPNNKAIISEIKSIQNILVIQRGLIDLDESKIYVNEQGILENELHEYAAVFERFQIISGITAKKKRLFFVNGKLTTYTSQEDTELERIEYSNNPLFDIYLELFNTVKEKFLYSQFGIVAYLSTRIRHGVLVGELRPIFETHNLITLKEGKSSNYRRNHFWDKVYSGRFPAEKEQIQIILVDFSTKIDTIIFDLIKKHLQVYKPGVNDDGWFNYEFDPNNLWFHSIASLNSKDFEEFVIKIFEILWERTDENLDSIREKIKGDVLNKFNQAFDDLEMKVVSMLGEFAAEPLLKAIKECSTEVQTVIQKISRWFKRSEIKASNFNFSELVSIIIEFTNKSNLHKKLTVIQNLGFDCILRGEYKTHFADLIRIFLENIIKHSDEKVNELFCSISTYEDTVDVLKVVISNVITDTDSLDSLRSLWKSKTPDTNKLLSEGKSGYHKAYKILTSDLKCSFKDCLDTSISEESNEFSVILRINIRNLKA